MDFAFKNYKCLAGEKRGTPFLANNHQARQNVIDAVRMKLGNAVDEYGVGTITYPLSHGDEVVGEDSWQWMHLH